MQLQQENPSNKRILEIDYLRGIAIILIILGHAIITYPVNVARTVAWCHLLKSILYAFHVPLLFFVAGFCYRCSNYKQFILKKSKHILVPYIVFGVSWALLHICLGGMMNPHNPVTFSGNVASFFLSGGGYWFLYVLFLMFLIYPLLEKIFPYKWVWLIFFSVLANVSDLPKIFLLDRLIPNFAYFIAGNMMAAPLIKQKVFQSSTRQRLLFFVLSVAATYLAISIFGIKGHMGKPIRAFSLIFCVGSFVLLTSPYWKNYRIGDILAKFLLNCSVFSLQLYLFDSYWQTLGRTILCSILKIRDPFIIVSVIFILNMVCTLIICNYILPRVPLLQRLCGIVQKRPSNP